MSRYLLLLLLNLPFIIAAIIGTVTQFKLKNISKRRLILQILLWSIVLIGLIAAEPIYQFLFSNNLTETEPLSLFDVIQITAIVVLFYIAMRTINRVEIAEERLRKLHEKLSIELSKKKN